MDLRILILTRKTFAEQLRPKMEDDDDLNLGFGVLYFNTFFLMEPL